MNRREQLIAKIERALAREGRLPEDPEKRQKAVMKQLKIFLKKLEVREQAQDNIKALLKQGYDTFKTKYAEWFIAHESALKSLDAKKRKIELEKKQEELRKMLNIPKDAVKVIIEKIEAAAAKIEADVPTPTGASMPSAKFTFSTTKPLTDATKKVYKAKLNKLAEQGFVTKDDLIANQDEVVKLVESLIADVPDERRAREGRLYFSAIFAAIHGDPLLDKPENPFRTAFRSYSPTTTVTGQTWMKLEDFKNQKEGSE